MGDNDSQQNRGAGAGSRPWHDLKPLGSDRAVQKFLLAIHRDFVENVDVVDSNFRDELVERGVLNQPDVESLNGNHLPTPRDKARKLWDILSSIDRDVFVSQVLPALCKHYSYIIPRQFWITHNHDDLCRGQRQATQDLPAASCSESTCVRCAVQRRVRPADLADMLLRFRLITNEEHRRSCHRLLSPDWPALFAALRKMATGSDVRKLRRVTKDLRRLMENYSLRVPDDLQRVLKKGCQCTCRSKRPKGVLRGAALLCLGRGDPNTSDSSISSAAYSLQSQSSSRGGEEPLTSSRSARSVTSEPLDGNVSASDISASAEHDSRNPEHLGRLSLARSRSFDSWFDLSVEYRLTPRSECSLSLNSGFRQSNQSVEIMQGELRCRGTSRSSVGSGYRLTPNSEFRLTPASTRRSLEQEHTQVKAVYDSDSSADETLGFRSPGTEGENTALKTVIRSQNVSGAARVGPELGDAESTLVKEVAEVSLAVSHATGADYTEDYACLDSETSLKKLIKTGAGYSGEEEETLPKQALLGTPPKPCHSSSKKKSKTKGSKETLGAAGGGGDARQSQSKSTKKKKKRHDDASGLHTSYISKQTTLAARTEAPQTADFEFGGLGEQGHTSEETVYAELQPGRFSEQAANFEEFGGLKEQGDTSDDEVVGLPELISGSQGRFGAFKSRSEFSDSSNSNISLRRRESQTRKGHSGISSPESEHASMDWSDQDSSSEGTRDDRRGRSCFKHCSNVFQSCIGRQPVRENRLVLQGAVNEAAVDDTNEAPIFVNESATDTRRYPICVLQAATVGTNYSPKYNFPAIELTLPVESADYDWITSLEINLIKMIMILGLALVVGYAFGYVSQVDPPTRPQTALIRKAAGRTTAWFRRVASTLWNCLPRRFHPRREEVEFHSTRLLHSGGRVKLSWGEIASIFAFSTLACAPPVCAIAWAFDYFYCYLEALLPSPYLRFGVVLAPMYLLTVFLGRKVYMPFLFYAVMISDRLYRKLTGVPESVIFQVRYRVVRWKDEQTNRTENARSEDRTSV